MSDRQGASPHGEELDGKTKNREGKIKGRTGKDREEEGLWGQASEGTHL